MLIQSNDNSFDFSYINNIDIAVKGLRPELFFKFYGELTKQLPKPVDLVDLSRKTLFTDIIEEEAVRICG